MSSPAAPSPAASSHLRQHSPPTSVRTGPTFAHDNDQSSIISNADNDNDIENDMDVDVDADIDELLDEGDGEDEKEAMECKWGECPEVFDDTPALVTHLHTDHIPGGKSSTVKDHTWTCEWSGCPRKGQPQSNRHSLITHCRTHTGERPYTCKLEGCGITFVRSDAMNKHFKTVHGPNGDRPAISRKERKRLKKEKEKLEAPKVHTSLLSREPIGSSSKPGIVIESSTGRSIPINPSYIIDWTEVLDSGLYEDSDLSEAVHAIQKNEPFWSIDEVDNAVITDYRRRYPRNGLELGVNGNGNGEGGGEVEDDFDEGIKDDFPLEPAIMDVVNDPESVETELRVLTRPRWQVRYMMAKAKLMLVEEENRMRRYQLYELMKTENELSAPKVEENEQVLP